MRRYERTLRDPCSSANKTSIWNIPSTKPERISMDNLLLYVLVVIILTMTSLYAVNGKMFTIGYVSDEHENDELNGPAISIAIESFQSNGWMQKREIR